MGTINSSAKGVTVALATGGTGGHIFPAKALADELTARGARVVLITDKRFVNYGGVFDNAEIHTIAAGTLGRGLMGKVSGALNIGRGIWQAKRLLRTIKPAAVVGFGGYMSFPTLMAARWRGVPTIIHEQNALLGRANRMLARKVTAVATSFDQVIGVPPESSSKTVLTGNPVRASIRALREIPYPEMTSDGNMRLLVMGGSLGASIFSRILPAAIAALPHPMRQRLRVDLQCRQEDLEVTRVAFQALGVSVDLATFFADVPARLASAHLVIARAGASTVVVLMAAGRPAILVPWPGALDNHQQNNANAMEDCGGGWVMPEEGFTAEALASRIEAFLTLPASLQRAAANAAKGGRIHAARDLAQLTLSLAEGKSLDDAKKTIIPSQPPIKENAA